MRARTITAVLISFSLGACEAGGGAAGSVAGVEVGATEVRIETDQMVSTYSREESIDGVYMVFGGMSANRSDMNSKATIVGLSMDDAQPLYQEYPDFCKCSSPGAAKARSLLKQMDIVPADSQVLAALQEALAQHKQSLHAGGDRVCVKVTGCLLRMSSAQVNGEEIMQQLPGPVRKDHYLVESAEVVSAADALQGG